MKYIIIFCLFVSTVFASECTYPTASETGACLVKKYEVQLQAYNRGIGRFAPAGCKFLEGVGYSVCIKKNGKWEPFKTAAEFETGTVCLINNLKNKRSVNRAINPQTGINEVEGYPVINMLAPLACPQPGHGGSN